jgi:hypothetical protein
MLGSLVGGQMAGPVRRASTTVDQPLSAGAVPRRRPQDESGAHPLAPVVIRKPEHGDVGHAGHFHSGTDSTSAGIDVDSRR